MSAPENPQAFPHLQAYDPSVSYVATGMTLRDWFAGQALAALSLRADWNFHPSEIEGGAHIRDAQGVARAAYRYADAMLATREEAAA